LFEYFLIAAAIYAALAVPFAWLRMDRLLGPGKIDNSLSGPFEYVFASIMALIFIAENRGYLDPRWLVIAIPLAMFSGTIERKLRVMLGK
jgi:hypothetical protein